MLIYSYLHFTSFYSSSTDFNSFALRLSEGLALILTFQFLITFISIWTLIRSSNLPQNSNTKSTPKKFRCVTCKPPHVQNVQLSVIVPVFVKRNWNIPEGTDEWSIGESKLSYCLVYSLNWKVILSFCSFYVCSSLNLFGQRNSASNCSKLLTTITITPNNCIPL